jgi:hypothetical protein
MKLRLMFGIAAAVLLAGCGGSEKKTTVVPTSAPVSSAVPSVGTPTLPEGFDPNKFSAVVLRPEDVPPGLPGTASFNPDPSVGIGFASIYGDNSLLIESSVVLITDKANRDALFTRTRKSVAVLVGGETNYPLPGADLGFAYLKSDAPAASSTVIFKDDYLIIISLLSRDNTQAAVATSKAELDRYTKLVFDRLQQLITDPESVKPIEGAPQYGYTPPATTPTSVTPSAAATAAPTP